jgi:hypothetical protein
MKGMKNLSAARLLCSICHDLRTVQTDGDAITLDCGHIRGELLPKSSPDALSLEDVGTEACHRWFPHVLDVNPAFEDRRFK